jgi:hypothetical protein
MAESYSASSSSSSSASASSASTSSDGLFRRDRVGLCVDHSGRMVYIIDTIVGSQRWQQVWKMFLPWLRGDLVRCFLHPYHTCLLESHWHRRCRHGPAAPNVLIQHPVHGAAAAVVPLHVRRRDHAARPLPLDAAVMRPAARWVSFLTGLWRPQLSKAIVVIEGAAVDARLVGAVCAHSQRVSLTRRLLLRGVVGFAERFRDPGRVPARAAPVAAAAALLTLTLTLFLFFFLLCFKLLSDFVLCLVFNLTDQGRSQLDLSCFVSFCISFLETNQCAYAAGSSV